MDKKLKDDYEWQTEYPNYHYWQTNDIVNIQNMDFELSDNSEVVDGKIVNHKLHENQVLLFETILKLQPKSVFEVGCGYCNHLISIKKLLPDVKIAGCDIGKRQLVAARIRYPQIKDFDIQCCDFLDYKIKEKFDVVYSNAVLMHMSTEKATKCLEKMLTMANNVVFVLDGKLIIPNLKEILDNTGYKYNMFESFAQENWTSWVTPPFIVYINDSVVE